MPQVWNQIAQQSASVSFTSVSVGNNQQITAQPTTTFLSGSFTGSFTGDGSKLTGIVASGSVTNAISASYSATASYVLNAVSASYASSSSYSNNTVSASYALTASYTPGSGTALSASYASTSSLPLLGIITASAVNTTITFTKGNGTTFDVTVAQSGSVSSASYAAYASTAGSASYATSASYSISAGSASYALTASYWSGSALNANSASYAITASYILNAISSSYASSSTSASYASNSTQAQTASYVVTAQTASFAQTASYVNPLKQNVQITGSVNITGSLGLNGVPIPTGTGAINQIAYWTGSNAQTGSSDFTWDNTNKYMFANLGVSGYVKYGSNSGYNPGFVVTAYSNFLFSANTRYNGSSWIYDQAGYGAQFQAESNTGTAVIATAVLGTAGAAATMVPRLTIANVGTATFSSGVTAPSFTGSFTGSYVGSLTGTASYATTAVSSSYALNTTTASYAINAQTASYVNPLNQNVIISGSLTIGLAATGSGENTLILGPAPNGGVGEGGQILLQASGGLYTSASMLDNYQNLTRLLRGTNTGSDAIVASFNMNSKQVQFPAYTGSGAFPGTSVANLAVDSGGNIITVATGTVTSASYAATASIATSASYATTSSYFSGSVSNATSASYSTTASYVNPLTQSVLLSGSLTATGTITAQTLVVQTVTSSIIYSSGSNIFGNNASNTQTLTGSVGIVGSLAVNGNQYLTGSITITGSGGNFATINGVGTFAGGYNTNLLKVGDLIAGDGFINIQSFYNSAMFNNNTYFANIGGSGYTYGKTGAYGSSLILESNGNTRIFNTRTTGSVGALASYNNPFTVFQNGNITIGYFIASSTSNGYNVQINGNPGSSGSLYVSGSTTLVGNEIITGSSTATLGYTGSLFGTASLASTASYVVTAQTASYVLNAVSASYALTASNVQGGLANYLPLWNTYTKLTSSIVYQDGNGNIGLGTITPFAKLHVESTPTFNSNGGYASYINNVYTVPASSTFNNGGFWGGYYATDNASWSGSSTINNGAILAGGITVNLNQFAAASSTITLSPNGSNIRAIAAMQVLQQTGGTINGTISHGAGVFIQGIYPTNTANVTFTNYYGLLINKLDEWGGITLTNRYAIYQAGASDQNYFAGAITAAGGITGSITSAVTASYANTATNITATSNSTLTTLSVLSLPYSQLTGAPSLAGYVTSVTGTSPIVSSGGTTPAISIPAATTSVNGYLTSTDWTTFNGKQAALSGTGFVKSTAGTISYDTSTYLTGNQTITLSGDVSGTGATAITTTIGALKVTNGMLAGSINYSKMDATTVPTWNQNTTGTASNITAYTINQSVGSSNAPTFTSLYLNAGYLYFNDTDRDASSSTYYPNAWTRGTRFSFANASSTGTGGNYAGVLHFHPWDGTTSSTGDASYQLAFGSTATNGGGYPQLRIRKGIDTTWNTWYDILTATNYNSYALPLSGGTLTGALVINGTGNRPVTIDSGISIKGESGGWAVQYGFTGSSGTARGGFGALGSTDALTYFYVGTYASEKLTIDYSTGAATFSSSVAAVTATITPNTTGVSTGLTVVNGDITTYRTGGTTGVIYLNSSGTRYLYWDATNYIMPGGQLDVNGYRVLNAGNYTSYSPTLTGGSASGTWGISITGNAATVTHNASRTDSTYYNVGWFSGASSPAYSCDAVQIQSSTGTLKASQIFVGGATGTFVSSGRGIVEINGSSSSILGLTIGNTAKGYVYHNGTDLSMYTYAGALTLSNSSGNILSISGTTSTFSGTVNFSNNTLSNVYQITHTNAAIKMYGNFHLDAFNGNAIYLQYYNQGVQIECYSSIAMHGYSISGLNTVTATTFSGALSGNATTATSATNLYGLGTIQRTSGGTDYGSMFQIRETAGYSGNSSMSYAPALGFHWGGIVASSIQMEASGRIGIFNNPGSSYENFVANVIYAASSFSGPGTNLTGTASSLSVNYATTAGSAPNGSNINNYYNSTAGSGYGFRFWNGSDVYKIHMGTGAEYQYGPVTDYSIKCNMDSNGSTRGFTWGQNGATPIAALNVGNGNMQIVGSFKCGDLYTTGQIQNDSLAGSGVRNVNATAAGELTVSTSDVTLKKNVENATYGLDVVMALRPVTYNWIPEDKLGTQKELGFIAQEVQELIPEVIGTNYDGKLSLDYAKIVAVLTKAIQDQQAQIEELKNIINSK